MTTLYCTNEHIAIRWPGDFVALCPDWQVSASGTDGVVSGWNLTSATVAFDATAVQPGDVAWLSKGPYRGSGELLAVDAVDPAFLSLRRIGAEPAAGMQPPAGSGVKFVVPSYAPQIEDATYDLKLRYGIDESLALVPEDARVLRQLCVLTVIKNQLSTDVRSAEGDWALKLKQIMTEYGELLARTNVRFAPSVAPQPSANRFSTRLSR